MLFKPEERECWPAQLAQARRATFIEAYKDRLLS